MTSSSDGADPDRPLPPALSSMWRLCKLGYSHEPGCSSRPSPWRCSRPCPTRCSRSGSSCSATACSRATGASSGSPSWRWACRPRPPGSSRRSARACSAVSATRSRSRSSRTWRRCWRPSRPSRTRSAPSTSIGSSVLRNQVFMLDHMYMSLFSTCGWILRLGVTVALLMSIHPALALLTAVRAADRLSPRRGGRAWNAAPTNAARRRNRLARHLFDIATTATPGKEVRVTGIGDRLMRSAVSPGSSGNGRSLARAGVGGVAHGGLGGLRRGLRGRHRVRLVGARCAGRRRAAGARGRVAALVLRRRHGRRDRLPARRLDGQLATSGVARRLRRIASSPRRSAGAGATVAKASASSTSRLPTPAPTVSCSTT